MVFQAPEKWKSPQDDGPALRLLSILDALQAGTPKSPRIDTIIQRDLTYLSEHVADPNAVDLWEEIRGRHYFNQLMQRQALLEASAYWPGQAKTLKPALDRLDQDLKQHHQDNLIQSSLEDRARLDSSVLLASLYAQRQGPDTPLLDPDLMATFWKLRQTFLDEYRINQKVTQDSDGVALEPGLGRYPRDFYDGSEGNPPGHPRPTLANPWFLITAGAAEYCYRLHNLLQTQSLAVDDRSRPLLEHAAARPLPPGNLSATDRQLVASGFRRLGDAYLRRVRHHAGADGSMSEQFHRETGAMTGATSLTWNYAALLRAIDQRR
jgi:glucoamylase